MVAVFVLTGLGLRFLPSVFKHHPHATPVPSSAIAKPPGPNTTQPVAVAPRGRPDGIIGPVSPWNPAERLIVAGERPSWFWPASGRLSRIRGLPDSPAGYSVTRAVGGWVIQAAPPAGAKCTSCSTPPPPVYFLADRAATAVPLGVGTTVAPAAQPHAAWLTTYVASVYGGAPGSQSGIAHEVRAGGRMTGPGVRLPPGYVIITGTSRGLLLTPALGSPGSADDELWNPETGHVVRRFGRVIGASPAGIAWSPPCQVRCVVGALDLVTGRQRLISLPAGSSPASAQFSPDGRLLALELSFGSGGNAGALAMRLEVATMATGRLRVVPGSWASSDALTGFGWPVPGDQLVAELGFVTKVQIASWHPGARRLAVAVVQPGQQPDELVVG